MEIQSYFTTKKGKCVELSGASPRLPGRSDIHSFLPDWRSGLRLEIIALPRVGWLLRVPKNIDPQSNLCFLSERASSRVTKYVISVVVEPLQLCYLVTSTVNNLQIFSQLCVFKPSNWSGTFGKLQVPSSSKVTRTPHTTTPLIGKISAGGNTVERTLTCADGATLRRKCLGFFGTVPLIINPIYALYIVDIHRVYHQFPDDTTQFLRLTSYSHIAMKVQCMFFFSGS